MTQGLDMVIKITGCEDECPFYAEMTVNRAKCSCCQDWHTYNYCTAADLEIDEGAKEKCPLKNGRIIIELEK